METLLTQDEVCERLKINRRTFYRMIVRGELKAFKIGTGWRVKQSALENYLEQQEEKESRVVSAA
jgi:excisionase family DNA binding protein